MTPEQSQKYGIRGEALFNRQTGEMLPEDEPIFIIRAKDAHAVKALSYYVNLCENPDHQRAVMITMGGFMEWAEKHSEDMREPDTVAANVGKQETVEVETGQVAISDESRLAWPDKDAEE